VKKEGGELGEKAGRVIKTVLHANVIVTRYRDDQTPLQQHCIIIAAPQKHKNTTEK
jgi:hypothetical protein